MPRTRPTAPRLNVVYVTAVAAIVLVAATSCGLLSRPPASAVVTIGKPAPAFELQALDSAGTVRFPDAFKGKVVALEFFSTG